MANYRGFSRFLGGMAGYTNEATRAGSRAARTGYRASRAASRVMTSPRGATGYLDNAGAVLNKFAGVASGKKFFVPFGLSMLGMGVMRGFTKETLGSPQGYAIMSDFMTYGQTNEVTPNRRPLGTVNQYEQYPAWRVDSNNPLEASGQLALALFATRHGR